MSRVPLRTPHLGDPLQKTLRICNLSYYFPPLYLISVFEAGIQSFHLPPDHAQKPFWAVFRIPAVPTDNNGNLIPVQSPSQCAVLGPVCQLRGDTLLRKPAHVFLFFSQNQMLHFLRIAGDALELV